jgi:hypothetical protein
MKPEVKKSPQLMRGPLGGHSNFKDQPLSAIFEPIPFAGRAVFRHGTLRVEGRARYPNEFSTATLEPLPSAPSDSSALQAFSVVFHRDKEPFCGLDRVGPVVYFSRDPKLARLEIVRVYVTPEWYEDIRVER